MPFIDFLVYSQIHGAFATVNFGHSQHPKRNPVPSSYYAPAPPPPALATEIFWICLFWTFLVNGIVEYMAFGDKFLFLSIKFPESIYIVADIRVSLIFNGILLHYFLLQLTILPITCTLQMGTLVLFVHSLLDEF